MRKCINITSLFAILIIPLMAFAETAGDPDLFLRIHFDNIRNGRRAEVGVFKKSNKDVTDKYAIKEYELVILNTQGKIKWRTICYKTEINLEETDITIVSGDLIVIRDVRLIDKKTGKEIFIEDITERYLIQ